MTTAVMNTSAPDGRGDLSQRVSVILARDDAARLAKMAGAFLEAATTARGQDTFYNSKAEQLAAEQWLHSALFKADRGLYTALLTLPGLLDRARQLGVVRLMDESPSGEGLLSVDEERALVARLVGGLTPPRRLKLFGMLRESRVNNARTRKMILRSILAAPRLELWSVRYRGLLRAALEHALGRRTASVLRRVVAKPQESWTREEQVSVRRNLLRYAGRRRHGDVLACVRFILGDTEAPGLPLLQAFVAARESLEAGAALPFETLEGIRSHYHPDRPSADVLAMTRGNLTKGQRIAVQKQAGDKDVEVAFDPRDYDAVKLYVYALERGMDDQIEAALDLRAGEAAERLPTSYGHVGILVDASASMWGSQTGKCRPMATALALRDMLSAASARTTLAVCGGRSEGRLVHPCGETSLGGALVSLMRAEPEAIFVLSDGYENAPEGRFHQVLSAARQLGVQTPVHQLSPVLAAEKAGLRPLSPLVRALPVARPDAMGVAFVRALLDAEPKRGLKALLEWVLPNALNTTTPKRATGGAR